MTLTPVIAIHMTFALTAVATGLFTPLPQRYLGGLLWG